MVALIEVSKKKSTNKKRFAGVLGLAALVSTVIPVEASEVADENEGTTVDLLTLGTYSLYHSTSLSPQSVDNLEKALTTLDTKDIEIYKSGILTDVLATSVLSAEMLSSVEKTLDYLSITLTSLGESTLPIDNVHLKVEKLTRLQEEITSLKDVDYKIWIALDTLVQKTRLVGESIVLGEVAVNTQQYILSTAQPLIKGKLIKALDAQGLTLKTQLTLRTYPETHLQSRAGDIKVTGEIPRTLAEGTLLVSLAGKKVEATITTDSINGKKLFEADFGHFSTISTYDSSKDLGILTFEVVDTQGNSVHVSEGENISVTTNDIHMIKEVYDFAYNMYGVDTAKEVVEVMLEDKALEETSVSLDNLEGVQELLLKYQLPPEPEVKGVSIASVDLKTITGIQDMISSGAVSESAKEEIRILTEDKEVQDILKGSLDKVLTQEQIKVVEEKAESVIKELKETEEAEETKAEVEEPLKAEDLVEVTEKVEIVEPVEPVEPVKPVTPVKEADEHENDAPRLEDAAVQGLENPFEDAAKTYAKNEAIALYNNGKIIEPEKGKLLPSSKVNRSQMAVVLSRVFDAEGEKHVASSISDTQGKWYENQVNFVIEQGLMLPSTKIERNTVEDNAISTFNPSDTLQRKDLAVYMYRVLKKHGIDMETIGVDETSFPDIASSKGLTKEEKLAITVMKEFEIFHGKEDGTFKPFEEANRAHLAKVTYNTMNLLGLVE